MKRILLVNLIILLLSGCSSLNSSSEEDFIKYQNGFDNILINYSLDNKTSTTEGKIKKN